MLLSLKSGTPLAVLLLLFYYLSISFLYNRVKRGQKGEVKFEAEKIYICRSHHDYRYGCSTLDAQ